MHIHEYHAFCVAFVDPTCRACFFTMESTSFKSKFIAQLNNSFGSGGMSLAFNDNQFSLFLQFLKKEAGRNLPIRKAVTVIGKQGNSSVWILGRDLHLDVFRPLFFQRGVM